MEVGIYINPECHSIIIAYNVYIMYYCMKSACINADSVASGVFWLNSC